MPEHRSIRLSDADDPERQEKFRAACEAHALNGNATLRKLIDAWLHYVAEHRHPPRFPVRLVPIDEPRRR